MTTARRRRNVPHSVGAVPKSRVSPPVSKPEVLPLKPEEVGQSSKINQEQGKKDAKDDS